MTLVVTATLRRGFAAGARVAVAPLVTDSILIAVSVLVLRQLPATWRAVIGLLGAAVVLGLAIRTWVEARSVTALPTAVGHRGELRQGAAVNLLNPQAWIFWTAVGAPLLVRTAQERPWAAVGFLAAFFLLLIGSKVVLAALLARGRHLLSVAGYRYAMTACAFLLVGLAVLLAWRGLQDLGLAQRL
ncbi:MAG: LysE family transporter [Myxococcales bacterium]|nr:LysE family transporter [Myxococcales bacterium]